MAVRPHENLEGAVIRTFTVKAAASATKYYPLNHGAADDEVENANTGEDAFCIALETKAAGEKVECALLTGTAVVPVRVGTGGATRGLWAVMVADGVTNQTLGGGTVVAFVLGKFLQSGVVGDVVGLMPANFASVKA